jgi:hypothetical protein
MTLDQIDRRTRSAQLALQVKNDIISDLGGAENVSTLERLLAEHASLAAAVTADSYARWLSGEQVPLTELATVSNTYMRAAMALGLNRRAKDVSADINEYLGKQEDASTHNT